MTVDVPLGSEVVTLGVLTLEQGEVAFDTAKPSRQQLREMVSFCLANGGNPVEDLDKMPYPHYMKIVKSALDLNELTPASDSSGEAKAAATA